MKLGSRIRGGRFSLAVLMVLGLGTTMVVGQGSGSKSYEKKRTNSRASTLVSVTMEGHLHEADSQAGSGTVAGSEPVFVVGKASDPAGRELRKYNGWNLHLVKNRVGKRLIREHGSGETMTIRGRLNIDKKTLEVISFRETLRAAGSRS